MKDSLPGGLTSTGLLAQRVMAGFRSSLRSEEGGIRRSRFWGDFPRGCCWGGDWREWLFWTRGKTRMANGLRRT